MSAADPLFAVAAWALAGLACGLVYFAMLRRTVDLRAEAHGRFARAALIAGRFAGALLVFGLAARAGALPLLTAFVGFLLARTLALRMALRDV